MRIKRRLRTAIESAAAYAGVLARFERGARDAFTILTYHRVATAEQCARARFPALVMSEDAFREQMQWLSGHFEVTTVSDGLERLAHGGTGERPLAAVTFDDGYADNALRAAPILNALGLRGTFFLVHDFVVRGQELWFDRVARATGGSVQTVEKMKSRSTKDRELAVADLCSESEDRQADVNDGPMSREQVLSLVAKGHEIGSHTLTHPILTRSDDESLRREVVESKAGLELWLGQPLHGFCYPNGDNDERVRSSVRAAGYSWACATGAGRNHAPLDVMGLQRIDVTPTRVTDHHGRYSELAFRSEISLLRAALRGND